MASTSGFHSTDTDTEMESDTETEMDLTPRNSIKSIGSFLGAVGASATAATDDAEQVAVSDMSFLRKYLPFLFRSRSSRAIPSVKPTTTTHLPATPKRSSPCKSNQSYEQESQDAAACSQDYNYFHHQSQPSQARSASPVPTEIDDPEPEYLEQQLVIHGAKIRDFAYEKQDNSLTKIPELWDQYEGIAEYEFRLTQNPRIYPITGRTIHRLIELGWVDREEVETRCAPMDLDELRAFEAKEIWPWTLKYKTTPKCTERPSTAERVLHMHARRWIFMRLDKMRRTAETQEFKKLKEKAEVEEAIKKGKELAMRKGKKRALEEDEEDEEDFDGDIECDDQAERSSRSSKRRNRRRTKKTNWDEELDLEFDYGDQQNSPLSHLPSPPPMPVKQYPAPLFSYDPQIYPEAASAIEFQQSQSQQYSQQMSQHYGQSYLQQSQAAAASSGQQPYSSYQQGSASQGPGSQQPLPAYQPVYSLYPARPVFDKEKPIERSDTPPLDEEDNRPNKLVRPAKKGLGRGLSRTQTFTQL